MPLTLIALPTHGGNAFVPIHLISSLRPEFYADDPHPGCKVFLTTEEMIATSLTSDQVAELLVEAASHG
jgi:hypothetical protein